MRGDYAYYLVSDHTITGGERALTIMRACHCSVGSSCPPITVLAEEVIRCGGSVGINRDGFCGVSVVENYAGDSGTSILISRCRPGFSSRNLVCLVRLSDVDSLMDRRARECDDGNERTEISWIERGGRGVPSTDCSAITVLTMLPYF